MNWRPAELDRIEAAIAEGARVRLVRRGTEYVLVPRALEQEEGSEVVVARHPNTGEEIRLRLDEIEAFDVLA